MSITITAARWANPEQSRAALTTTERGAVLLKPERPEWADLEAWIAAGGAPVPYAPPPAPTWKDRRRAAIREQILGSDGALAEIVEILVIELLARGTAQSTEFATLLAKINDIRAAYPKP